MPRADALQDLTPCSTPVANFNDGSLQISSDLLPVTDMQIQCTCGSSTFTVPLAAWRQDHSFSLCSIWQAAYNAAAPAASPCASPVTNAFDLPNCQINSISHPGLVYANLAIHSLGNYYTYDSQHNYVIAVAGALNSTPAANYDSALASVNNPNILPVQCNQGSQSYTCYNQWAMSFEPAVLAGNLTLSGVPDATIKAVCTQSGSAPEVFPASGGSIVIDLQTLHDKFTADPNAPVTVSCRLVNAQEKAFGSVDINAVTGTRVSQQHAPSTIWSAAVTVTQLVNLQASGDSDSTGQYHTIWTAQF